MKEGRKVLFIDVAKDNLDAPVGEGIKNYVDLPPECGKPGKCGLLNFWLYGMRPASHGWQEEYTKQLEAMGFVAGVASPCCFYRKSDDVCCVVHGDDFTMLGSRSGLDWFKGRIGNKFEIKYKGRMGERDTDMKSVRILNRAATMTTAGIEYESDQRHAEIIVKQMGQLPG